MTKLVKEHTENIGKCTVGLLALNQRVDQTEAKIDLILEQLRKND